MATAVAIEDHPLRVDLEVSKPDPVIGPLNILIYGDPGVGKTYLCGTAADHEKTSPVLLIDVEGGTMTIRNKDIDIVSARTLGQLRKIVNKLIMAGDDIYYKTVIVDSLTELQRVDMSQIMNETKANAKNPDRVDVDVPSAREWGKSLAHSRAIVRAFRDLPCNTILTCLAHSSEEEGQPKQVFPSMPGKARNEVPGFMDIVGYYYGRQVGGVTVRKLQFASTVRVLAKDRTGLLGDSLEDPTFPEIFDMVHKGES